MDENYENIKPKTNLKWLNKHNGAAKRCVDVHKTIMKEFKGPLTGVIMGSAYGGELEALAKLWGKRGTVYGVDTFTGHPEHLAVDASSDEARCMDHWYRPEIYGTATLSYEYQRSMLDDMGLDNVVLLKGEVSKDTCKDIPTIHYALLDMDMIVPMKIGMEALRGRMPKGSYLCIHDVIPAPHLGGYLYGWWYGGGMKDEGYEIVNEFPNSHLGIYRKL